MEIALLAEALTPRWILSVDTTFLTDLCAAVLTTFSSCSTNMLELGWLIRNLSSALPFTQKSCSQTMLNSQYRSVAGDFCGKLTTQCLK